jgi:hypothetical protein
MESSSSLLVGLVDLGMVQVMKAPMMAGFLLLYHKLRLYWKTKKTGIIKTEKIK